MADGDSWNDVNSDLELDNSAADADVDDDDVVTASGQDSVSRKKNKKKKRGKGRDLQKSSGDSDCQMTVLDDQDAGSADEKNTEESTLVLKEVEELSADSKKLEQMDSKKIEQISKTLELLRMPQATPKNMEEARRKQYQFWDTQPVPKLDEEVKTHGPIDPDKPVEELRQEPYSLPAGFVWDSLDINNTSVLKEVYTLLNENYVEDDDNMFRFDYSPDFLHWALQPPGWRRDWHIGVRVVKSGKLIGFISGVPAHIRVYDHEQLMVEINFLCVHKKLRSKRVAPVLIREVTRRVNCQGIFQAVYTAGVVLPKPVSSCRYWHRSLNPRKLIDVKFSHLSRNMTMQRTLKLYKLPEASRVAGFRMMTLADIPEAFQLVTEYLKKFDLVPVFTEEEFRHWFVPQAGIIDSFVVETEGHVTDLVSFYTLPSTVMHHPTHKSLKAAYAFYNVATRTPLVDLIQEALIAAKNMGFDVFNALDLMNNKQFLDKLKFGVGDGNLQYYLYNWKCPTMLPEKVGLVLQ